MSAHRSGASHDVVVIGAGVIGLAVAYELARRGRIPIVLDRGPEPGCASHAAAGMLAPISEADVEDARLVEFGLDSLERFPALVAQVEALSGISCGFRREGTLWVGLNRDEEAELTHLESALSRKGLSVRRLSPEDVARLEPHLSSRVVAGLRVAGDLQVDPRALCAALASAVVRLGGEIQHGARVEAVEDRRSGALRVVVSGAQEQTIDTPVVVLAAGAWAGEGIRLPIEAPRVRPVKGQLVRLRGAIALGHVIRSPECYLVSRVDGELLIGASVEEVGWDTLATAGAVHDLLRHAWRVLPGIYDMELVEVSVGLRPALPDHLPAIGPTAVEGLFFAVGHYRNGVLLAPATAHHLVDAILEGTAPLALAPFATDRSSLSAANAAVRR